jgi:periplasmic divalent cation tolerance protein
MTAEAMVVLTTCSNDEDAAALARWLVEQRLAACVNAIGKVASTYRWQDRVEQDQETLLIIKTTAARLTALEKALRDHSKYELPEFIALPVHSGGAAYLDWVRESVAELKD